VDAESLDRYPYIKYLEFKRIKTIEIGCKAAAPSESSEGEGNR